jgi:KTSC domain
MNWIDAPGSSNIARYRYVSESQVLEVEFLRGGTYRYFDVPETLFQLMNGAPSKGQFLAQQVKGKYRYARM